MERMFVITDSRFRARLDVMLVEKFKISRKEAKRLIDAGRVRVGAKRILIAGWELKTGDRVRILDEREAPAPSRRRLHVYFEDRDLIVVEKPAGLHTVPPPTRSAPTLVDAVRSYLQLRYRESGGSFAKALHRLDVETSGVIVLAKSKSGEKLSTQFRDHSITREYNVVIEGGIAKSEGVIDIPLEKGRFTGGRKTQISSHGRKAVTLYRVLERYPTATLLEVSLTTGRTHQVRVHFAHLGHPVVGDKIYGSRIPFRRHALHASLLGFRHPVTGRFQEFRSPLPPDFARLLDSLRSSLK